MAIGDFTGYPMITPDEYAAMRKNPELFDKAAVGFYSTQMTFAAQYFGTWFCTDDVHLQRGIRNCLHKAPRLRGVEFFSRDYRAVPIPERSIIYCDPPYLGTFQHYGSVHWKQDERNAFFEWAGDMSDNGHDVFISEESAPDDWIPVFRRNQLRQINDNRKDVGVKQSVENLFIHKNSAIRAELADFAAIAGATQSQLAL